MSLSGCMSYRNDPIKGPACFSALHPPPPPQINAQLIFWKFNKHPGNFFESLISAHLD